MKTKRFQGLLAVLTALAAAGHVSSELQTKAKHGQVKTTPLSIKYVAKNIEQGGGTIDLVDSNTKELVGVSNFRSNRLDTGNVFIFDTIRVYYAKDPNETDPSNVNYSSNLPTELDASELEFYTNGKKIVSIPLQSADYYQNIDSGYAGFRLANPAYLLDNNEFEIKLKMPRAFGGTDHHFIKIEMEGIETII